MAPSRPLKNSCGSRHLSFFRLRREAVRSAMRAHRASDATTAGAKKLRSQRDAAKLSAGQRRIGWTWDPPLICGACRPKANPNVRQRSLPALNFRSHRDLTEFFNSLLLAIDWLGTICCSLLIAPVGRRELLVLARRRRGRVGARGLAHRPARLRGVPQCCGTRL